VRTHPWHPLLVHFPIACWTLAALIDSATLLGALPESIAEAVPGVAPAAFSFALLWLGLLLGVAAIVLGLIDLLGLPPELQRSGALNWHVVAMLDAWGLFLGAALLRPRPAPPFPPASLAATVIEIAGFFSLGVGGVLASAVVFDGWPHGAAGTASESRTGRDVGHA
jgi:uncharacterized membrane protein